MDRIDGLSLNLEKNNIDKIKELFPEAVEEGKINFDMLRTMLGDEVDDSREKYQFTWNGKAKSIKLAQTPSSATLRPCKEKSKDWDTTENLYIEGDNLEVLKQLQKTYYGKIKMIYIDPPYNTGNDFVYNDSFSDSISNYKEQTNQSSSSNPESAGRFHTKWLNMIYPRLILSKNLLMEDGIIFVSIDDCEYSNLKCILDEVFGSSNYIETYIKQSKVGGGSDSKFIVKEHEYCIVYAKNIEKAKEMFIEHDESYLQRYKEEDERGKFFWDTFARPGLKNPIHYNIITPDGTAIDYGWIHSKERFEQEYKDGIVKLTRKNDGTWSVQFKQYLNSSGKKPRSMTMDFGGSSEGKNDMKSLFANEKYFSYPKSVKYISTLLSTVKESNCYILDFFSGSATTAHAVMKLNAEDGGNRKFIMVQLPELCAEASEAYKAGYKNICDIGEERIRRAGEQIKSDWDKEHPQDTLLSDEEEFTTDIGFKVFKLDSSNLYEWDNSQQLDERALNDLYAKVFKIDRSSDDIVYEIMLKYGVFDKKVEKIKVNDKTMYRVGKRYMIICLESEITLEDIKAIGELSPKTVVFNESSFKDDNEKINAINNLKKTGVEDIKCI